MWDKVLFMIEASLYKWIVKTSWTLGMSKTYNKSVQLDHHYKPEFYWHSELLLWELYKMLFLWIEVGNNLREFIGQKIADQKKKKWFWKGKGELPNKECRRKVLIMILELFHHLKSLSSFWEIVVENMREWQNYCVYLITTCLLL